MKAFITSIKNKDHSEFTWWLPHNDFNEKDFRKKHNPKALGRKGAMSFAENRGADLKNVTSNVLTDDEKGFLGFLSNYLDDLSQASKQVIKDASATIEEYIHSVVPSTEADNSKNADADADDVGYVYAKRRIETLEHDYESQFDEQQNQFGDNLKIEADKRVVSRVSRTVFRKEHGLQERPAVYPESHIYSIALVIVSLVLEALVNAKFYAEADPSGLVGGWVTAFFVSLGNVMISFILGLVCLRYLNHKEKFQKVIAGLGTAICIAAISFLHLATAHYRELLLRDPDNAHNQVLPTVINNPLGINDMESFIMILLGVGVTIFVIYKGYQFDDPYPGYGKVWRSWKEREDTWLVLDNEFRSKINPILSDAKRDIVNFEKKINARSKDFSQLELDLDSYIEATKLTIENSFNKFIDLCREYRIELNETFGGENEILLTDSELLKSLVKDEIFDTTSLFTSLDQEAIALKQKRATFNEWSSSSLKSLDAMYTTLQTRCTTLSSKENEDDMKKKAMERAQESFKED